MDTHTHTHTHTHTYLCYHGVDGGPWCRRTRVPIDNVFDQPHFLLSFELMTSKITTTNSTLFQHVDECRLVLVGSECLHLLSPMGVKLGHRDIRLAEGGVDFETFRSLPYTAETLGNTN